MPKWFFVYNHLQTVHAIASCNAAEMAIGMLMEATTSLRAQARLQPPDFGAITEGTELTVPVSVVDRAGAEVVHADITCWVTPAGR